MESQKVAVLDLGTNTFNLLLAKITAQAYFVFHSEKIPVMIGKNGISRGIIAPEAQLRAETALRKYKSIILREGVDKVYGFATSAFRNAENGVTCRADLEKKTGLPINIISGETEARYIYKGVASALDIGKEKALIIDIGGGSIEFIIADSNQIYWLQSFEIGAQRLFDLFHVQDPIAPEDVIKLEAYLKRHLVMLDSAIKKYKPAAIIGSSGAFDTLSEIYCKRASIDVNMDATEFPLPYQYFEEIHQELLRKDRSARLAIQGMIEMRVDMIVVASCLIHFITSTYGFDKIRVSAHALKEGILKLIQEELYAEQQRFVL